MTKDELIKSIIYYPDDIKIEIRHIFQKNDNKLVATVDKIEEIKESLKENKLTMYLS